MKRAALLGAAIGAIVALGIWLSYAYFGYMAGPETVVLWPASVAMLGLEGQKSVPLAVAIWLVAGLVNALLYAALGCCALAAYRLVVPNRGAGA